MGEFVKAIPEGYHTLTPGFAVAGCSDAIAFYARVFGAEQTTLFATPDGTVIHCEMRVGDSRFMFGEPMGREPYTMHAMLYVPDCDATYARAIEAGATSLEPVKDHFYGDRGGRVVDPFGNHWFIATHTEDLTREQIDARFAALLAGAPPAG